MTNKQKWKNSTKTRTYYAWRSMRNRCSNPLNASWDRYGGRGVSVCPEWDSSYDTFFADMGEAPEGKTLDRIDVNGDYCPANCRWATWKEQANNKTTNVQLTYDGLTMTMAQWADYLEINRDTLFRRLRVYKMSLEKVLSKDNLQPVWKHGTRQGYERHKCKCELCTKANTLRHRLRREAKNLPKI